MLLIFRAVIPVVAEPIRIIFVFSQWQSPEALGVRRGSVRAIPGLEIVRVEVTTIRALIVVDERLFKIGDPLANGVSVIFVECVKTLALGAIMGVISHADALLRRRQYADRQS